MHLFWTEIVSDSSIFPCSRTNRTPVDGLVAIDIVQLFDEFDSDLEATEPHLEIQQALLRNFVEIKELKKIWSQIRLSPG